MVASNGPVPSIATGPPLSTVEHLIGGPTLDDLVARAASRAAERVALRFPGRELDYACLDRDVSAVAAALTGLLGPGGAVVAVCSVLAPSFPISFYGTARAGLTSAIVNALLPADRLVHLLRLGAADAAVIPAAVFDRIRPELAELPRLRLVLLTDDAGTGRDEPTGRIDVRALDDVLAAGPSGNPGSRAAGPDDVACLQFTSGTTGTPKAVRLTHRNLLVNAAQAAYGHRLTDRPVLFDHLPVFHPMLLDEGVAAVATHVVHPGSDVVEAVHAAVGQGATHFYGLPARLATLATDPRLDGLRAPGLRAILSGGSALRPEAADALAARFGIPVVQGYGLAETSSATHIGDQTRPRSGACGVLVAGTACRVVDVRNGEVLPRGDRGEVQVRGPQLMLGYVGEEPGSHLTEDGWLPTGDVGRLDDDGMLHLVDRIKDVFKCDGWLVAPSDIERVLSRHPEVVDCAVVDYPDEVRGAVACGLVVPRHEDVDPEQIARVVNARVPDHEQLRRIDVVAAIPRSPTGKVLRRDLRASLLAAHDPARTPDRLPSDTVGGHLVYAFINRFTVTGDPEEFEQVLGRLNSHMSAQPGWRSHHLYRSSTDPAVYVEVAEWTDAEAHGRATATDGFRDRLPELIRLATADHDRFVPVPRRAATAG